MNMSWFSKNSNLVQGQINNALATANSIAAEKDLALAAARRQALLDAEEADARVRRAKMQANDNDSLVDDLEYKNAVLKRELILANNAINEGMVETEAFKRLAVKFAKSNGKTAEQISQEISETKKHVSEELNVQMKAVPPKPIKNKLIPNYDPQAPLPDNYVPSYTIDPVTGDKVFHTSPEYKKRLAGHLK